MTRSDERKPPSTKVPVLLAMLLGLLIVSAAAAAGELPTDKIRLPAGFRLEVFAEGVANARQIAPGPAGLVFVGSREAGKVYVVQDRDGDGRAEHTSLIAEGLEMPSGLAYGGGALYVADVDLLLRYDAVAERLENPPAPVVVADDFPADRYHGWRHLAFGPDGRLHLPIGIPCDICARQPPYGSIIAMNPDGSGRETLASGIRSVQGLAWHPRTGELWFPDNGRNHLGDDAPPDEINRLTAKGQHFGAPYCHGSDLPDPEFGTAADCAAFAAPAMRLPAHVSPLGIAFYDGVLFPEAYRGRLFIAEHGSWDRSTPVGYRITSLAFDAEGRVTDYEVFAEGWLEGEAFWGRPTDLQVMPDGALLVSDDHAGALYRITYVGD